MIEVVEFSIRKYRNNISGLKVYNKSSHHVIQNHTTYAIDRYAQYENSKIEAPLLLTGMYSSILPPAKTPKSFGPSFLSESMVKITFSITIPVIKIKS